MESIAYKQGQQDGQTSRRLKKPIHENWKAPHPNLEYLEGYENGLGRKLKRYGKFYV